MADSAFWRDIEGRFRALQPRDGNGLLANWTSKQWNENGDQWYLSGTEDRRVHQLFKWLAERAALECGHPGGPDALFFWLGLLRNESPNYHDGLKGISTFGDKVEEWQGGTIDRVCEASADYCLRLETRDMAKRRNPPSPELRKWNLAQEAIMSPGMQQMRPTPKTFVSYTWESDEHRAWVCDFAARLRTDRVDVTLDRWHLQPGDQLPAFMERAVRENDFVLIVCTPQYRQRSDGRLGGVGYEGDIMTAEVLTTGNERKFIPIFRLGDQWTDAAPTWLRGKYYIDLRGTPYSDENYQDLMTTLHGLRPPPPALGTAPQLPPRRASKTAKTEPRPEVRVFEPIRILGIVVDAITQPLMDGTPGSALYTVPFQLSRRPQTEWSDFFIEKWNHPRRWTTMHRPGIASISGDRVYLTGTTVDEVKKYHRDTLKLALEDTNAAITQYEHQKQLQAEKEHAAQEEHSRSVQDAAQRIKFD